MKRRFWWTSPALVLLCCVAAFAQAPLIPPAFYAVQGAPYTLSVLTHREVLNGRASKDTTQRIVRDAAGRQRYEAASVDGATASPAVDIYDVVAGKHFLLNLDTHTAEVSPLRLGRAIRMDVSAATSTAPSVAAEGQTLLGTREILGLEAWGQRTTRTMTRSDGSPVEQTRELWLSTHYRMPLLQVLDTPQLHMTQSVVVFQAAEPDPALFRVPDGFTTRDAPGPAPGTVAMTGDVSRPLLLKMVQPEFSPEARERKINGDVLLHLVVDEQGMPQDVRVLRGLGSGLDERATQAVRQYRFKPAMRNGMPVRVELNVNVNFAIF